MKRTATRSTAQNKQQQMEEMKKVKFLKTHEMVGVHCAANEQAEPSHDNVTMRKARIAEHP